MYKSRIEKLLNYDEYSAHLITSPENLYYFSGFTGGEGALFIDRENRILLTDSRYTYQAKEEAKDFLIIDTAETPLSEFLKKFQKKVIGFEDSFVTFKEFLGLKKASGEHALIPASDKISAVRMIKDEYEIELISKSAEIADKAFSYILNKIEAGKTEREISLDLEYFMFKEGANGLSFETIAASGVRSAMPHGVATDKVIEKGDFLTLDFGCKFKGYCSDMTRTVVIGKATEKQKEIYNTVLNAQKCALSEISAGALAKVVDSAARNYIKDHGYGKYFGHGLGHSLGLLVHEKPSCSPKSEDILTENMLMTVEPGIYIEDFGGARIEDLVVVKNDGFINLTKSTKELLEL